MINNIASEETYHDGEVVYKEGSSGDWVYVVQSGSVEVTKTVNNQEVVMERLGPGEIFGEVNFFVGTGRLTTARAIGDTKLGVFDRDFLDREFNRLPDDFRVILVATAQRIKKIIDRSCEFTLRKEPRVEKVLPVMFKSGDELIKGYLGNLSTWGLFVGTDNPLEPGKRFGLKLNLPGVTQPVQLRGEVVWARRQGEGPGRPPGMGVSFRDIDIKDYNLLKTYIQEQGKEARQDDDY